MPFCLNISCFQVKVTILKEFIVGKVVKQPLAANATTPIFQDETQCANKSHAKPPNRNHHIEEKSCDDCYKLIKRSSQNLHETRMLMIKAIMGHYCKEILSCQKEKKGLLRFNYNGTNKAESL